MSWAALTLLYGLVGAAHFRGFMDNPFPEKTREVSELEKIARLEEKKVDYAEVLKKYGGLESNIPINHPYWRLRP